jgi:hypothetical protein
VRTLYKPRVPHHLRAELARLEAASHSMGLLWAAVSGASWRTWMPEGVA